jgi:hypothetical protein
MNVEAVRAVLGWSTLINIGLLLWWFLVIVFAHDWVYKMHSKWFNIPVEKFDAIHYSGMAIFKIAIFLFNLVPYIALSIVK